MARNTQSDVESCRYMIDSIREILGKEPLYGVGNSEEIVDSESNESKKVFRAVRYQRDQILRAKLSKKRFRINWTNINLKFLLEQKQMSVAEIAKLLQCGDQALYNRMKKLGLQAGKNNVSHLCSQESLSQSG